MSEEKPYWKKLRNTGLIIGGIGLFLECIFLPIMLVVMPQLKFIRLSFAAFYIVIISGVLVIVGIIILITFAAEKKKENLKE